MARTFRHKFSKFNVLPADIDATRQSHQNFRMKRKLKRTEQVGFVNVPETKATKDSRSIWS